MEVLINVLAVAGGEGRFDGRRHAALSNAASQNSQMPEQRQFCLPPIIGFERINRVIGKPLHVQRSPARH